MSNVNLTFHHDDAASDEANQFFNQGAADKAIGLYGSLTYVYSSTTGKWLQWGA